MITRKSQVTVEFLFAVVFILFVFLLLLGFIFQRSSELTDTKDFLDKKSDCLRISSLISSVYSGGDGTSANVKTDYRVTIHDSNRIAVEKIIVDNNTKEENVTCYFAAQSSFHRLTGDITIRNVGGNVVIS